MTDIVGRNCGLLSGVVFTAGCKYFIPYFLILLGFAVLVMFIDDAGLCTSAQNRI
jgi:hypothetical protein